jgi:hypothetical protein
VFLPIQRKNVVRELLTRSFADSLIELEHARTRRAPRALYCNNNCTTSGLVYFSGISTPEECGDMWGFGVHPILSNPLKYSSPKILYHDGEFLI